MNSQEKIFYVNVISMVVEDIGKLLDIINENKKNTIMTVPLPVLRNGEFIYNQDKNIKGIEFMNAYSDAGELQIMARDIWYVVDDNKICLNREEKIYACYSKKASEIMIDSFQKAKLWVEQL